jgi:XamI-like restriction endonuclease
MPINADKPNLWKKDVAASVDLYNTWFVSFAPTTYRETRARTTEQVKQSFEYLNNLRNMTPAKLSESPSVLPTLRMCTAPPIARDRLIGLAKVNSNLVHSMEEAGRLPPRMDSREQARQLANIAEILRRLLDADLFPWLERGGEPTETEIYRAATIVADRLTGAVADPVIRNAQEQEQLRKIDEFLRRLGYEHKAPPAGGALTVMEPQLAYEHKAPPARGALTIMEPRTFTFRLNVPVGEAGRRVNIPIDVVIQPKKPRPNRLPILIEAKSAGDFTNTNKRRKEEAQKIHQLRATYGNELQFILFLRGYFDTGYLGYEAAEGLDWIWEHRMDDLLHLGI